jgi:hypothetical protein
VAGLSFTVQIKDLGKWEKQFAKQLKHDIRNEALRQAAAFILPELTQRSQPIKDRGKFRAGWRSRFRKTGRVKSMTIYNAYKHAIFVERGRRAGAAQPPFKPIAAWCRRHGMRRSAAWAVMRAIAARGIQKRPVLYHPEMVRRMIQRVVIEMRNAWDAGARRALYAH